LAVSEPEDLATNVDISLTLLQAALPKLDPLGLRDLAESTFG